MVADSDIEAETATSVRVTSTDTKDSSKFLLKEETSINLVETKPVASPTTSFRERSDTITAGRAKAEESENNSDIIYSQDLIIRNYNLPASIYPMAKNGAVNFKRFRKVLTLELFIYLLNLISINKNDFAFLIIQNYLVQIFISRMYLMFLKSSYTTLLSHALFFLYFFSYHLYAS